MTRDQKALLLIFRAGDIQARELLIRMSETEYRQGNRRGCVALVHAEMYLARRKASEASPPPDRLAIPMFDWPDEDEREMQRKEK